MLRFFAIASLIAILAAGALLVLVDRQIVTDSIMELGESSNVMLASAIVTSAQPQLQKLLAASSSELDADSDVDEFHAVIQRVNIALPLERIRFYNESGVVLYSSESAEIGAQRSSNPRFRKALGGDIVSELSSSEKCMEITSSAERCRVVETYVPFAPDSATVIQGVFEIYTDVAPWVETIRRDQALLLRTAFFSLALLYAVIVGIAVYSSRLIGRQKQTIKAKDEHSAQLWFAYEEKRRRVSRQMHEGVAQKLAALKFKLENASAATHSDRPILLETALTDSIPLVGESIAEIRDISTALRPAVLDDFGVLPAIEWLVQQFESIYEDLELELRLEIEETGIPKHLNTPIFRIVEEALSNAASLNNADRIWVALRMAHDRLTVTIDDNGAGFDSDIAGRSRAETRSLGVAEMRESARVSRGSLDISGERGLGTRVEASWPLIPSEDSSFELDRRAGGTDRRVSGT